ncbi:VOC family protein [Nonomuraea sp. MCN248]|uniref:VOC family protein n=1 Tax=Nonomuraea corallina TaxID=2989783 RepID=A0ABT4SBL2_9ACTN|nr:VOC family protein [Nonomuraea corallina]MDA0634589.1 VOC family protein [Nonomuraea corallina]
MKVYALARYHDCAAAVDFLTGAFGFEAHDVSRTDEGTVHHAELRAGDDIVMLGLGRPGGPGVYVAVDDVDAHHDRARAAGAKIIMELVDQPYGSREYAAEDPQGNAWYFGTYRP